MSGPTQQTTIGGRLVRRLPLLVLVVLVGLAVAAFVLARRTVDEQERRILDERTGEVALVLESALAQVPASVRPLGVAARLGDPSPQSFLDEARVEGLPQPGQSIALIRRAGGQLTVLAGVGDGLKEGESLTGPRADAVERALAKPELTSTQVFGDARRRLLGFAIGPPVTAPETVIYLESAVDPRAAGVTQSRPFDELDAVLYATSRAARDQVVITTTPDFPLRGDDVESQQVRIQGATWLLTTTAKEPLVGSFAKRVPWILLAAGLLGALLTTAVVVGLMRRRDYALALVEERTTELESSLGTLKETQARLVLQERLAAIGQVAAAVGHELRNPLGVLTNSLYLIRATAPNADQPPTSRHLDTAEREVSAAAAIVDTLLDFAREREPITQPVDLADLIEESLSVAPPPEGVGVVRLGLDDGSAGARRSPATQTGAAEPPDQRV